MHPKAWETPAFVTNLLYNSRHTKATQCLREHASARLGADVPQQCRVNASVVYAAGKRVGGLAYTVAAIWMDGIQNGNSDELSMQTQNNTPSFFSLTRFLGLSHSGFSLVFHPILSAHQSPMRHFHCDGDLSGVLWCTRIPCFAPADMGWLLRRSLQMCVKSQSWLIDF